MRTDSKILFHSLIKVLDCDLILDVGSCDGSDALGFRNTRPEAQIVAFEANPHNFRNLRLSPELQEAHICTENLAVTNHDGVCSFYVRPANYDRPFSPTNNIGCSSLLPSPKATEQIEVKAVRLDSYLATVKPGSRVAVWMDVEGAEHDVVDGLRGAADRISLLHIETAVVPLREGQKTFFELNELLESLGFVRVGSTIPAGETWGDVVFVNRETAMSCRNQIRAALCKAAFFALFKPHHMARWMRGHCPGLYLWLRKVYGRNV